MNTRNCKSQSTTQTGSRPADSTGLTCGVHRGLPGGVWGLAASIMALSVAFAVVGNLVLNGDFEEGLTGWVYDSGGGSNVIEATSEAQSPFTAGSEGMRIYSAGDGAGGPHATRALTSAVDGPVSLSFDFQVTENTAYKGIDGALLVRLFTNTNQDGVAGFKANGEVLGAVESTKIAKGVWYRVNVAAPAIDAAGTSATMTLTDQDGNVLNFTLDWGEVTDGSWTSFRIQTSFGNPSAAIESYLDNLVLLPHGGPDAEGTP